MNDTKLKDFYEKRYLARKHAFWSGLTYDESQSTVLATIQMVVGGSLSLLTPTLKFHYTQEEIEQKFTNDETYGDAAYYTEEPVSTSHLGITRGLIQGFNQKTLKRIHENPAKSFIGFIQIASGIYLSYQLLQNAPEKTLPQTVWKTCFCLFGIISSL